MLRKIILTLVFTLAMPFPLHAMPGAGDRYDAMDADKDGRVTWAEFEKAVPSMKKEAFDTIDANKDAAISREEWNGFRQNHGMKSPQGSQPPQPSQGSQGKPLIMPPQAE